MSKIRNFIKRIKAHFAPLMADQAGFTLPGGFSPREAIGQIGSYVGITPRMDYDVFSEYSVRGGDRSPSGGGFVGRQGSEPGARPAAQPSGSNNSGSVLSNSTAYVAPDPYARWGGEAAYNALRNQFGQTQSGYRSGAETSLRDVKNEYGQKTRNFLNEIEDTQGEINRGGSTNALNLRTSMANIIRGIQQGIRSGGVALAGMNAMDSGASPALARAYAQVGNEQTGEARGQAAEVTEDLRRQQGLLNRKEREGVSDLDTWRGTETGRVRSDFTNKLQNLEARTRAEGIDDIVKMSLVDQVLDNAISQLAAIDKNRSQRLASINPWDADKIMQDAIRREQAGETGEAFSVSDPGVNYGGDGAPLEGAPIGQLPIYVRDRDELGVLPAPAATKKEQ